MQEKSIFAQNLQRLRKGRGLTQRQLADRLAMPLRTIINYENERREPNCRALVALERFFGVTGSYLMGLEDPIPAAPALDPITPPAAVEPRDYLISLDVSDDGTGIAVMCDECEEVLLLASFQDGKGVLLRLPQTCPKCEERRGHE